MGSRYQGFALTASQLRHVTPSPRPQRSPPSATNLRPAKGRRLGHGPLLGPLRAVASSIPRTAGDSRAMKPGCALPHCHLQPPVAPFGYEKYYARTDKQDSRAKPQKLFGVPTVYERGVSPHPHGRRYNGASHLGTLPAPRLNPAASPGARASASAVTGEVESEPPRMRPLAESWWRKQGRVPGALSLELGILGARELRLQETKAEGLASGQCAPERRFEAQRPSSPSRTCVCLFHSCSVLSQPLPPAAAIGMLRNSWPRPPALLSTRKGERGSSGRSGAGFP